MRMMTKIMNENDEEKKIINENDEEIMNENDKENHE
jgi:hypothetical protein